MNDQELGAALATIHQGRRQLPDAPFVRHRLLAIDLERVPARRLPWPGIVDGHRGLLGVAQTIAAGLIVVVFGSLLLGGLLVQQSDDQRPVAVSAASPSPVTLPSPDARPSPITDLVARRAQTQPIVTFEDEVDPIDLERSLTGALYYIDARADAIVKVDPDGYQTLVVAASDPYGRSATMTSGARLLATSQRGVFYVRSDGTVWEAQELPTDFNLITLNGEDQGTPAEGPREPRPPFTTVPVAAASTGHSWDDRRLYAIDETSGNVTWTKPDRRGTLIPARELAGLETDGLGPARDIHADGDVYVLHERGLRRYRDGQLDRAFAVELPTGDELDLRHLSGTGRGAGRLYALDAVDGGRMLEFDKADGRLIDAWVPADEPMDDVRGFVASAGTADKPASVTWITPTGVYESVLDTEWIPARPALERPSASPTDRPADKAITWAGPSVQFEADSLRIEAKGKVFEGVASPEIDDWAGIGEREFDAVWHEDGIEQRLKFILHADGSQWWVDEIWTYDGAPEGGWVYYRQLDAQTRTPLGESLEGDLRLDADAAERKRLGSDARLRIDGLRLTAYEPGTGPAELAACLPLPADVDTDEITVAVMGMTPAQVEAHLTDLGYCHEYRYEYTFDPAITRRGGNSERWCVAPPEGEVRWVSRMDRTVLVDIEDFRLKTGKREQPLTGWGCPLDDGTVQALPDPLSLPSAPRTDLEPLPSTSPGARPERGFVLEFETATMLPGQRQRVEAKWCAPDGCVPVDTRWSVDEGGAMVSRTRGSWTELVAIRPGSISLRADTPMVDSSTGLSVMPSPEDARPLREVEGRAPVTYPLRQDLAPGEYFVLTSWRCASKDAARFGDDGRPGTEDDRCTVAPIDAAGPVTGAGVSVIDRVGPSVLLRVDPDGGPASRFAGVFLRYEDRAVGPFPLLYVRERGSPAPVLGDFDGDDDIDVDDLAILEAHVAGVTAVLPAGADWDRGLDLNQDRRIDAVDLAIEAAMVEAQG